MDQGHDSSVLVLQVVRVSVTQCVVIFYDSVAANLAVSKQPKERSVGEHLAESICLDIALVVVVVLPSPHAGKHKSQGVFLWNFGCL